MSKGKWIALVIALFLVAPPTLSAVLRPFALSCRQDNSMPIVKGFQLEFFQCDFGLPQPLEFLASTLASGSYTMALLGFIALGLVSLLGWMFWIIRTTV